MDDCFLRFQKSPQETKKIEAIFLKGCQSKSYVKRKLEEKKYEQDRRNNKFKRN